MRRRRKTCSGSASRSFRAIYVSASLSCMAILRRWSPRCGLTGSTSTLARSRQVVLPASSWRRKRRSFSPRGLDGQCAELRVDAEVARAHVMAKAVRCDEHKMAAFVRFCVLEGFSPEKFCAWYDSEHHIIKAV